MHIVSLYRRKNKHNHTQVRAVHFCQNLMILRHSGPASDSERRAGTQRKCQNAKRFVP